MKKCKKNACNVDYESQRQARVALLVKILDVLDDNECKMTSCEIRIRLLDIVDI